MRTGDTVLHRPSGESWIVACVDEANNRLWWLGWPEGSAELSDCELLTEATDEKYWGLIRTMAEIEGNDHRGRFARGVFATVSLPNQSGAEDTQLERAKQYLERMANFPGTSASLEHLIAVVEFADALLLERDTALALTDQLTTDLTAAWANNGTLRAERDAARADHEKAIINLKYKLMPMLFDELSSSKLSKIDKLFEEATLYPAGDK